MFRLSSLADEQEIVESEDVECVINGAYSTSFTVRHQINDLRTSIVLQMSL